MNDDIIDVQSLASYALHLLVNPEDRDPRMDELVKLYVVQQRLICQFEEEELTIALFRWMLISQWGE